MSGQAKRDLIRAQQLAAIKKKEEIAKSKQQKQLDDNIRAAINDDLPEEVHRYKGLSNLQNLYVHYYVRNGNKATAAARSAGYADNNCCVTASRLKRSANIKAIILEETARYKQQDLITPTWIENNLKKIALDENAKDSDKIRANELLGKERGMFRDKSTAGNIAIFQVFQNENLKLEDVKRPKAVIDQLRSIRVESGNGDVSGDSNDRLTVASGRCDSVVGSLSNDKR